MKEEQSCNWCGDKVTEPGTCLCPTCEADHAVDAERHLLPVEHHYD